MPAASARLAASRGATERAPAESAALCARVQAQWRVPFDNPPSMLHPSLTAQRWLLALAMLCLLLAWPLHQAQHAGEPVGAAAAWTAELPGGAADSDEEGEHHAELCLWCLSHASHDAMGATPPALRFHAEASAPPALLAAGQLREHSALAAHPRGPPAA